MEENKKEETAQRQLARFKRLYAEEKARADKFERKYKATRLNARYLQRKLNFIYDGIKASMDVKIFTPKPERDGLSKRQAAEFTLVG